MESTDTDKKTTKRRPATVLCGFDLFATFAHTRLIQFGNLRPGTGWNSEVRHALTACAGGATQDSTCEGWSCLSRLECAGGATQDNMCEGWSCVPCCFGEGV